MNQINNAQERKMENDPTWDHIEQIKIYGLDLRSCHHVDHPFAGRVLCKFDISRAAAIRGRNYK